MAVRLHVLFGLGCLLGSLVSCAKGGGFLGTGGSSSDNSGGAGGSAGSAGDNTGGATTTSGTGGTGGMSTTSSSSTTTPTESCTESPCKLVSPQCGCMNGDMCAIDGTGATVCHAPGDKLIDQACTGLYSCAPGSLCTQVSSSTSLCTAYCDNDAQCNGGLCLIQLNDPGSPGNILPGITLCSDNCDPVTGVGCPGGFGLGCQLGQQQDGAMQVFAICNGSGNGGQGAACTDNEDCLPGYGCFNAGTTQCLQYCKPPNGICSGGATCVSFNPQLFYKGVEYGACL